MKLADVPKWSIRHRAITMAFVALAMVWGAAQFMTSPRREDPEFKIRVSMILTQWPGAPTEKVEHLVTDHIEKACNSIEEVKRITSESRPGVSVIYVELEDEVQDLEEVWSKLRAKVNRVKADLPTGCGEPEVNTEFGDTAAMVLAVYQESARNHGAANRYSPREMEIFAEKIKDELELLSDVGKVELHGVQKEVIYIEAEQGTWANLDLTTDELRQLLEERNIVAPGGIVETPMGRFNVTPTGEFEAVTQIENVVVNEAHREATTPPIYLSDLGLRITRRYLEPPNQITRVTHGDAESRQCVAISLTMKKKRNIVELGKKVKDVLADMKSRRLPADVRVAVVSDTPQIIELAVGNFTNNLYEGIAVVIAVAFLMIGFRIAVVMASAIPITMLIAFGIVRLLGVQLEQVSIAALIISLGMLVDCAIEVADNVHRYMEDGLSRLEAAAKGAGEIAFPVLMATLTTVFAFLPMLLLKGSNGEYVYSLPVVVATTLMVSWVVALTATALMSYWLLRPSHADGKGRSGSPIGMIISGIRNLLKRRKTETESTNQENVPVSEVLPYQRIYGQALRWCLKHKILAIGCALVLFCFSLWLLSMTGTQYFPAAERAQFTIDINAPEGTPIERTAEITSHAGEIIRRLRRGQWEGREIDRLESMISYIGEGGPRFFLSLNPEPPNPSYAQIVVNTTNPYVPPAYVAEVRQAFKKEIPDARVNVKLLDLGPGLPSPIAVRISGEETEVLRRYADKTKNALAAVPGSTNVHDNWGTWGYRLTVDVDQTAANLAGVTNASVAQSLNAYYSGHYLTTFREEDHLVPVFLRLPAEQRILPVPQTIFVEGLRGKVPLEAVAEVITDRQPAKIARRDMHRTIEARASVKEGVLANDVLSAAMPKINRIRTELPPGYRLEIGGEQEEVIKSQQEMSGCFGVSVLLIVLCLVIQYNSYAKPLVILLTIPMAATGAFIGLFITGNSLSFMAQLGLLSLAGVVLNDAIVLIDFTETQLRNRLSNGGSDVTESQPAEDGWLRLAPNRWMKRETFRDCMVKGQNLRILPIYLTTFTTVGGLLPLLFGGGPLWTGMAIVIIFGLALATFLTTLIVPTIYATFVEKLRITPFKEI
jgi:multidrug efflux pump subunit AcrB